MIANYFAAKDFLYLLPGSLVSGAVLASLQPGSWLIGFASFSILFLFSFTILLLSYRWANGGRMLGLILALAFVLRLGVGILLHFGLPIYGHADEDDRAGYVFTDAHRRDNKAWELANSELPVIGAFSERYGSDQYGGLLAFNTFVYRYFSPDAQRPLMLVLLSAFFAALGMPLFWRALHQVFGERVAWASTWIFALFPDSILLGASAMREPYLLTFNTLVLWGFVHRFYRFEESPAISRLSDLSNLLKDRIGWMWIALGLTGMLLVSPAIALTTIVVFAGWLFFASERREISWRGLVAVAVMFALGLFFLSASLNRSGEFVATSPLHVINDWFQAAVKWDAYQLERESGWVQKIFDESPRWIQLPFVAVYGIFQPVLSASIVHPTIWIWKVIVLARSLSWYALLPVLILAFVAASGQESRTKRNLLLWLAFVVWAWILLASLRGGADLWDNPRYRTILFVWQAVLTGSVWVWWRETRNPWFTRVLWMEAVFLIVFTQWYASRYFYLGGQLPFAVMVALILGCWGVILGIGWWRDKRSNSARQGSGPLDQSRA
ncbi:MAG TPA: hypothetical protein VK900_01825 [Anaerolineales bacterium]|nr:hypothetical protein [Anaerolineales bacterium]